MTACFVPEAVKEELVSSAVGVGDHVEQQGEKQLWRQGAVSTEVPLSIPELRVCSDGRKSRNQVKELGRTACCGTEFVLSDLRS